MTLLTRTILRGLQGISFDHTGSWCHPGSSPAVVHMRSELSPTREVSHTSVPAPSVPRPSQHNDLSSSLDNNTSHCRRTVNYSDNHCKRTVNYSNNHCSRTVNYSNNQRDKQLAQQTAGHYYNYNCDIEVKALK